MTVGCVDDALVARLSRDTWETDTSWYEEWQQEGPGELGVQFTDQKRTSPWSVEKNGRAYEFRDSSKFVQRFADQRMVTIVPKVERGTECPIWTFGVRSKHQSKIKKVLEACDVQP